MRIREQIQHLEDALAPLVAKGWTVARVEVVYDEENGEHINLQLRFSEPEIGRAIL